MLSQEQIVHLQLKRAKGLDDVAEDEEDVAHAQGAQQGVEQGRHRPAEKHAARKLSKHLLHPSLMRLVVIILCR